MKKKERDGNSFFKNKFSFTCRHSERFYSAIEYNLTTWLRTHIHIKRTHPTASFFIGISFLIETFWLRARPTATLYIHFYGANFFFAELHSLKDEQAQSSEFKIRTCSIHFKHVYAERFCFTNWRKWREREKENRTMFCGKTFIHL